MVFYKHVFVFWSTFYSLYMAMKDMKLIICPELWYTLFGKKGALP